MGYIYHSSILKTSNILLLCLLWGDLFLTLSLEWSLNEQYQFGYLVPWIGAYLIFLRWQDRPSPEVARFNKLTTLLLFIALVCLYPTKIILESNPDWRLMHWTQSMIVFGATLTILYQWGGAPWLKHFSLPFLILLFSVPWPTQFEQPLIQGLMRMVAAITVDTFNLLGIYALQKGNIIMLTNGLVGVEEACSGVRSFQSTLMLGYFLGELFRFNTNWRVSLLGFGVVASIVLNIIRTLTLTFATHMIGPKFMEHWHDPVGYLVSLFAFVLLLFLSFFVKKNKRIRKQGDHNDQLFFSINWLNKITVYPALILLIGSAPFVEAWYQLQEPARRDRVIATIDWTQAASDIIFEDIPGRIRSVLRYSEGKKARWNIGQREHWITYYFNWEEGNISSFSDVHRPEVCLPAAGYTEIIHADDFNWSRNGLDLEINTYILYDNNSPIFVFFSVWNDLSGETVPSARSKWDRLDNAMKAKRLSGRRSLEIIVSGLEYEEEARMKVLAFLDRSVNVDAQ